MKTGKLFRLLVAQHLVLIKNKWMDFYLVRLNTFGSDGESVISISHFTWNLENKNKNNREDQSSKSRTELKHLWTLIWDKIFSEILSECHYRPSKWNYEWLPAFWTFVRKLRVFFFYKSVFLVYFIILYWKLFKLHSDIFSLGILSEIQKHPRICEVMTHYRFDKRKLQVRYFFWFFAN